MKKRKSERRKVKWKIIDLLDPDIESLIVEEIEALVRELSTAIKKNEKEVKEKITEVMEQAFDIAPRNEVYKKVENQKAEKLKKRMEFLKEKTAASELKVEDLIPADITDNEIREKYIEAKEWEKVCKEMVKSKEDIEEDCIGLDIDENVIDKMKESVQNSVDTLQKVLLILNLRTRHGCVLCCE